MNLASKPDKVDSSLCRDLDFCPFSQPTYHQLATQLIEAVRYIHSMGIVHTDIAPSNILLASEGMSGVRAIVAGFGGAVHWSQAQSTLRGR